MKIGNGNIERVIIKDADGNIIVKLDDNGIKAEKGYQIEVLYDWVSIGSKGQNKKFCEILSPKEFENVKVNSFTIGGTMDK